MSTKAKKQVQENNEETVVATPKKRISNKITKEAVKEVKKENLKTKRTKAKEELDTKNIKDTVKAIVETERELRYNYPEDVVDQIDRKKWRQKVRNKLRSFERELNKIEDHESKDYKKINKELQAYRKEVLMVP